MHVLGVFAGQFRKNTGRAHAISLFSINFYVVDDPTFLGEYGTVMTGDRLPGCVSEYGGTGAGGFLQQDRGV